MKWFDQWFRKKCIQAWEHRNELDASMKLSTRGIISIEEDSAPWQDGLRVTIKKVIGGFVVSFRTYDRVRDRSDERHYIITDDQDFNTELGKTITMESMRQS
jgi:hypothetical protein